MKSKSEYSFCGHAGVIYDVIFGIRFGLILDPVPSLFFFSLACQLVSVKLVSQNMNNNG